MELYHYTCEHSAEALGKGEVTLLPMVDLIGKPDPVPDLWWPGRAVWLTDLDRPERNALGLTSNILLCDRTTHRYRVLSAARVYRWTTFARTLPRESRALLEYTYLARPAHWFVSAHPVPAVFDPVREQDT